MLTSNKSLSIKTLRSLQSSKFYEKIYFTIKCNAIDVYRYMYLFSPIYGQNPKLNKLRDCVNIFRTEIII